MSKVCSALAVAAPFSFLIAVAPAAAQTASRAWVSGHGTDAAGCGAPTAPCRSLQYAHDHIVAAGGEIDILDPAGYGAITITKAVSIVNDGVGTAGVQAASGNAITVNAGINDVIYLRGLNIDGQQASGANGILLTKALELTIDNCVVRHFSNAGVLLQPPNLESSIGVAILDSLIADNSQVGVKFEPSAGSPQVLATLDRVRVINNGGNGIVVSPMNGSTRFAILNSEISHNGVHGVELDGNTTSLATNGSVKLDSSHLTLNSSDGFLVQNGIDAHVGNSDISENFGHGINIQTTGSGGVFSTGDNRIVDNVDANVSGTLTSEPLQ
jgi:hypothetical protein